MKSRLPEEVLDFVRLLRTHQTDAENLLWLLLRNRGMGGFKFRRQYPVSHFILDFYCNEARLAVEVDGGEHNEEDAAAKDQRRTEVLGKMGIRVIRFWNHEVLLSTEAVLEKIFL